MHNSTRRARRIVPIAAAALLLWALSAAAAATPQITTSESEAVLYDYFFALQMGDLASLRNILGGALRAKSDRLLQNPDYAQELIRFYGDARFSITDFETRKSGRLIVSIEISSSPSERIRHRLTLERSSLGDMIKIVDMEEMPLD